ncbi:unnamed protein product, partial [Prorocentrum cordatum]
AVLKRAQGLAGMEGSGKGAGRGAGGGRPPAAGSKREQRLETQLAELTRKFDQLTSSWRSSAQQGGANGTGAGGAAAADGESGGEDPLRAEAALLEQAIAACKGDPAAAAKKLLEEQLKSIRGKIEAKKPDLTQHNGASGQHANIGDDVSACQQRLDKLQQEKEKLEEKRAAAEVERAELQRQLVASLPLGEAPVLDPFGVPQELLDGKAEIKNMLESDAFKKFAALYRSRPQVPHRPHGDERPAASDGVGGSDQQPVPMDEFDDLFEDSVGAEQFWDKHKGDKRAILDALLGARAKRPKMQQL